jgi:type I restriction enzyme S subunit
MKTRMETHLKLFDYFKPDASIVPSKLVCSGGYRLTAEFFRDNTSAYLRRDLEFKSLSEFATVFGFGPFKRYYIDNPENGIPLISSSEMMEANPSCEGYISRELQRNYRALIVKEGWILVSCSGTIGNVTIVDNRLVGSAISQHALRVAPKEARHRGFLYTYLSSDIGQKEVRGKKSGAVIDEIYEDDLLQLPIPLVDDDLISSIDTLIGQAISLREEANAYLAKADRLVHEYSNLPELRMADAEIYDPNKDVSANLVSSSEIKGELRLDACFYNPLSELATKHMTENAYDMKPLKEVTERIFYLNRFSRTFVGKDFGIPYLAGKDIIKIRPTDMHYLSKQETAGLESYFLNKGWMLLTCSGTIGRCCFVWNNYESHVATHDLIRIIPGANIDGGYLFAFLSSEYGYHLMLKYKHGAVIDHITPDQVALITVPIPKDDAQQVVVGDLIRSAYDNRAKAIQLEDVAQDLLNQALTSSQNEN